MGNHKLRDPQAILALVKLLSQAEGVTTIEPMVTAGTSRSRRICTMSRKMAKSTSQWDFFGTSGMHYMAYLSTTAFDETPEDLFHNYHLDLQEHMQNPITFHAEMMGDIMYYDRHFNSQMQRNLPVPLSRR